MSKFILVHEDGAGWDASGVKGEVYGSKGDAVAGASEMVSENVKRAYWVCKVQTRVAAVVTVASVDEV